MPEIELKMGTTQKLMGKNAEALKHYYRAVRLKNDYVVAYVYIIDIFKEYHDYARAMETAKRGLKYAPNSELLKSKLAELRSCLE
jgi:tetratricopeptide (TPR) repeat protein